MSNQSKEELAAMEAIAVQYLKAFSLADVVNVLAAYSDDGVLLGPGLPAAVGKEELAKVYPKILEAVDFKMNFEIKEVVLTSQDWGFVRSATEGTETDRKNGKVTNSRYNELFLLKKLPLFGWRIARYCTSKISSEN